MMDLHHIVDMLDENHFDNSDSDDEEIDRKIDFEELINHLKCMKKPPDVLSLRNLVLNSIARNINYWMECLPENPSKYLYIITPFDNIGTNDSLQIIKKLVEEKEFTIDQLHLFFSNKLTKMDFNIISSYTVNDKLVEVMFNRCKNIRDLSISSKSRITYRNLKEIPLRYGNLEYLFIDCKILKLSHFQQLKCLKLLSLKNCSDIPDQDYLLQLKDLISLRSLTLNNAQQLKQTTLSQMLNSLTKLNELVLEGSTLNFISFPISSIFVNIKILNISWSQVSDHGISTMVKVMPNIVDLSIAHCESLTTKCYKALCQLENLKILNASYLSSYHRFDDVFELFLMKIGCNLISLDISGMASIHLNVVARCCPSLRNLTLHSCSELHIGYVSDSCGGRTNLSLLEACNNLESISFACLCIKSEDLPKLFKGDQSLKRLSLRSLPMDRITQELFHSLISNYDFDYLQELDLINTCVDFYQVIRILKHYPKLRRLVLVNCDLVENEKDILKNILVRSKSLTKIEVSPSYGHPNVKRIL